jgi:hypothetical protein
MQWSRGFSCFPLVIIAMVFAFTGVVTLGRQSAEKSAKRFTGPTPSSGLVMRLG